MFKCISENMRITTIMIQNPLFSTLADFPEKAKGDEVGVLSRGFLYAGAKALIATLWSIDDRRTEEFMERFYTNICEGKDITGLSGFPLKEGYCRYVSLRN